MHTFIRPHTWPVAVPPAARARERCRAGAPPARATPPPPPPPPPRCSTRRPAPVPRLQAAREQGGAKRCQGLAKHRAGASAVAPTSAPSPVPQERPSPALQPSHAPPSCQQQRTAHVFLKLVSRRLGRPRPAAQHFGHQLGASAGHLHMQEEAGASAASLSAASLRMHACPAAHAPPPAHKRTQRACMSARSRRRPSSSCARCASSCGRSGSCSGPCAAALLPLPPPREPLPAASAERSTLLSRAVCRNGSDVDQGAAWPSSLLGHEHGGRQQSQAAVAAPLPVPPQARTWLWSVIADPPPIVNAPTSRPGTQNLRTASPACAREPCSCRRAIDGTI